MTGGCRVVAVQKDTDVVVGVLERGGETVASIMIGDIAIEGPVDALDAVLRRAAERLCEVREVDLAERLAPYRVTRLGRERGG